MSKVLYIKANAKQEGQSRTFMVSERFVETYKTNHPNDEIITLDLYKEGINFLQPSDLPELRVTTPEESRSHRILKYAYQFLDADKYIVAAPMWNLSTPAIVKAYIDYICITGITFKYTANGPVGLCNNKKAVHIAARGGAYSEGPAAQFEMGERYLRTIFGFLGITDFTTIAAENLDVIGADVNKIVEQAIDKANALAKSF
jgi:FMN-dependent NADH-azoreductase